MSESVAIRDMRGELRFLDGEISALRRAIQNWAHINGDLTRKIDLLASRINKIEAELEKKDRVDGEGRKPEPDLGQNADFQGQREAKIQYDLRREAENRLQVIKLMLPATYYAGLSLEERIKIMVAHWRAAVDANHTLEQDLYAAQKEREQAETRLKLAAEETLRLRKELDAARSSGFSEADGKLRP